jgi:hypothetical protein
MTQSRKQIRRQAAVIEDLFAGGFAEQEVLRKHHVRPSLFERWLADKRFVEQFEQRIARAQRQGRMTLARCAPKAADTLVELMGSKNQETARKACLDILALHGASAEPGVPEPSARSAPAPSTLALSPETASRLLAALARDRRGGDNSA